MSGYFVLFTQQINIIMMNYQLLTSMGIGLMLASCASYKASNIELSRDSAQWQQVSSKITKQKKTLSSKELHQVGLLLNPGLNSIRLQYAKTTAIAENSGYWKDPSLGFSFERPFGGNTLNYGIMPGITLPVTGLPALSKKIAEQYKEADYWTSREAERAFLEELDNLHDAILISQAMLNSTSSRLSVIKRENADIEQLYKLGEMDFAEYQISTQRFNDCIKAQQDEEDSLLTQQLALIKLLGLHPSTPTLRLAGYAPRSAPAARAIPSAWLLLEHPALKASSCKFAASEIELKSAIRAQYPELELGVGYGRDDGKNKLDVGIGLSLPIWNRNREAIAMSTADRALKQQDFVNQWRALLTDTQSLKYQQQLLLKQCRSEASRLNLLRKQVETQEKLYSLGESGISELSELRHESYQRQLDYFGYLKKLQIIQTKIQYLSPITL